ncbi:MAG TPA: ferrochelatase [Porphyromonadaceae bacterium]|jgi:ferrochelatase|uniref:ferrochelatase n=1 Tax=Limibacterium fermenti TaxID=3229863 RepID=UPI000E92608F|nr:ferrochelatase [Porphyromonadaceae bacterium]HBK32151.1 ferrochelatase [Porphyromonadaceae bacterium]HBL32708.1 ferrochelatase [Porphyromonadaceae bacterium]HBX19647.1 ferrochelatase [Porphyromonadaceae bacterium]HBX45413.1 ferrochelatase [Porphyromonadaceae bacterium]
MQGLLLVNVGTPATTHKADVQQFIGDMLSDPLLLGYSEWLSAFLAHNLIAPLSASQSKEKYKLIWRKETPEISPILYHMRNLANQLEKTKNIPTEIAMRYGEPSIENAFKRLEEKCPLMHELIVFPMFPHYAQSTTQTVVNEVGRIFYRRAHSFRLKFVEPFYNHPAYIQALAMNARPYLDDVDRLVFSYHSLPVKQVKVGWEKGKDFDYVYQLKETNRLFCENVGISLHDTFLFYSSQRGKNWLRPFLDKDITDLPRQGWKKVAAITPGFLSDNMETLYDVDWEARQLFMEAGGEKFVFIPSLNDTPVWVEAVWKIISDGIRR